MGLLHSCLGKKNKVGVLNEEETEAYEKAQHLIVADDMNEAKGGVAFDLMFGRQEKLKPPPSRLVSGEKDENFEDGEVHIFPSYLLNTVLISLF